MTPMILAVPAPSTLASVGLPDRNCSRCNLPLTDAASRDFGVGPVCRKLDNALLAQSIPGNPGLAAKLFSKLNLAEFPAEAVPTAIEVEAALGDVDASLVKDWRVTVKRSEWLLSFPMGHTSRTALIGLVQALGYVGLAAVWMGEAAKGSTTVGFADGRIFVWGPRNSSANKTSKKIAGWKFHPAQGEVKAGWSFPAAAQAAVHVLVVTHYPNQTGLVEALLAANTFNSLPAPVAATLAPAPKWTVKLVDGILKVLSPYNPAFVTELKALPYKDRSWDAAAKCWSVAAKHEVLVTALLTKHYPAA